MSRHLVTEPISKTNKIMTTATPTKFNKRVSADNSINNVVVVCAIFMFLILSMNQACQKQ